MPDYDITILGAGAAGLMAAISAARCGRRTLLLEKNKQAGVKILMSGGTRCNITQNTDNRGIVKAYGTQGKFLHSALAAFSVADTVAFFHEHNVATKIEETGKIFPVSNQASDVRDELVRAAEQAGATIAYLEPVKDLQRANNGFSIVTSKRTITTQSVILTTGGLSFPGSGTTGDGYAWAKNFGHTIVPTTPALVPLTTTARWALDLMGVTLPDVTVKVVEQQTKLAERRGSLLFAHFGLTGPTALDVSRVVSSHPSPGKLAAVIDLLPEINEQRLTEQLQTEVAQSGKRQLQTWVTNQVPQRLGETILQLATIPTERKLAELSKDERQRVIRHLKHLAIPLSGTLGYKKAEVTAGGVSLAEVDSSTMQSKLVPGLFFAGEIVDLDGPIGGYNFQAAWSTGWLAGARA